MLYFSRLKTALIAAACVLGVVLCLPNVLPAPAAWVPWRAIHLGLDLRGGSYLLLQVDMATVIRERVQGMVGETRQALVHAGVGYTRLAADPANDRVVVTLRDAAETASAMAALREAMGGVTQTSSGTQAADVDVAALPGGQVAATLSRVALTARAQGTVSQSIEIVRRRIDSTGVVDPEITRQGDDRIVVQLPGVGDPERIKALLGTTAKMTFHLVDEGAGPNPAVAPPGDELVPLRANPAEKLAIAKDVAVDGADLTDARAGTDQNGAWVVNFAFNGEGTRKFGRITEENVGRRFAVVLDNAIVTAPVIQVPITGGRGEITGSFSAEGATDLAVQLRSGALPAPLSVIEERTVGPQLGAASIRAGAITLAVGFVLVIAFMAVFYGLFGWFANIALVVNLILMLAVLSVLQATLTLPGMAGILLTLGMAVDANILINERIREEVRNGRTPLKAMEAGFTRAYSTILDSNMTAFLAHVMLFAFGTGPVRGFAVTITVGIATTLFTATVVARLLMVRWFQAARPKVLPDSHIRLAKDGTKIKFMKGRYIGLMASAGISTLSAVLFFYPGLNLGIDFRGGIVMDAKLAEPASQPAIEGVLRAAHLPGPQVQRFGGANEVLVKLPAQADEKATQTDADRAREALQKAYPGTQILRTDAVGSTVSNELFTNGLLALGISLLMILAYIWFRFELEFAVGAVITLLLDVTKAVGFLAITRIPFDLVMVAAILTIIGYSTNDKVVVYDRIRENLRKYKKMPLREMIDLSINETLNRTLGTSSTVFLAALPLALFGGDTLSGFATVMLFGIAVGTASSIYIASPILLLLGAKRLRKEAPPPVLGGPEAQLAGQR